MDISADLTELGRTPIAVICAGVKSILDIGRTLEYLVILICILRKDIGVGKWFRKWQFPLTLHTENVLTYGAQKVPKHPYIIDKCSLSRNYRRLSKPCFYC